VGRRRERAASCNPDDLVTVPTDPPPAESVVTKYDKWCQRTERGLHPVVRRVPRSHRTASPRDGSATCDLRRRRR